MKESTSNSWTSPAIVVSNPVVLNFVTARMPDCPALIRSQNRATSQPKGETTPSPVTTILLVDSM
jgi:hypothetical protein